MIGSRDIARHFRAAPWTVPQEIRAFVTEAGALPAAEIAGLLPILLDKTLVSQHGPHRNRCIAFTSLVERAPSEDLFVPCVRALKLADPFLRKALIQVLPKVNKVAEHAELCQILGSSDSDVRRAAAEVLGQVGGRSALAALEKLMEAPGFPGRLEALEAIVAKAGHHALQLIAATVRHGKPPERAQALRYLADPRFAKERSAALAVIVPTLQEPDERIAAAAIVAFGALATEQEFFEDIGARIDDPSPIIVRAVIEALQRHRSPRVIAALGRKLRLGPNPFRLAVLETLQSMGGDEILPLLVEALGHKQQAVRNKAAEVVWHLAQKGEVDLSRMVLWLLRSRDVNVRRIAVELAKKLGGSATELAPRLLAHLRDEDWWVRERVIDAVVEMMGSELTRHILPFLKDPSDVIRRWAIGALTRLKDPRALGALVRAANEDTDWWVREQAIEATAALGDLRATPYILHLAQQEPELRPVCVEALRTLKATDAAPQVAELVTDPDPEVRLAAIRYFESLGSHEFAPALRQCVNDPEARVHRAAVAVLTRWNELRRGQGALGPAQQVLDELLVAVAEAGADDLVLGAERPPYIKKHGAMSVLRDTVYDAEALEKIVLPHLSPEQSQAVLSRRDVDFSYEVKAQGLRFRANVFRQATGLGAVFRIVKQEIPDLEDLGLPPTVASFVDLPHGLVLVGGPTGSGKSTTLAAIIADINRRLSQHVITFEDPIEVLHRRDRSLITQREVGTHISDLATALRATLRQDPDVILMGEMRDLETIAFAITAAETGHLVFGTVHTVTADTTVDRLINAFPTTQQSQVRAVLSDSLRAVVCQHLLRRADGSGRIAALEVMLNNDAVSNLIRKGKTFQIPSVIATSREQGMQSMDSELLRLLQEGKIYPEEAFMKARDKSAFESFVEGDGKGAAGGAPLPERGVSAPRGQG